MRIEGVVILAVILVILAGILVILDRYSYPSLDKVANLARSGQLPSHDMSLLLPSLDNCFRLSR